MKKGIVAIVGRPNVGKSTLFNKLTGRRTAIVDDKPGVTRDRIYGDCDWNGKEFSLIDTGGIEPTSTDTMLVQMREQAQIAIDSADVIVFVTDLRTGILATDEEVARILLRSGKPVVLCVNKVDQLGELPTEIYDFYKLGLGEPYPVSSVHGHGTGDLLDELVKHLPEDTGEDDGMDEITVAIIGKPNVGKSSLVNKLSGENRVVVTDIPGTTRDATDTFVENEHGKFNFIDTAGLRRKSKVKEDIEYYSTLRTRSAVERAEVALIMIDAEEGFTEQDTKVAGLAHDLGKASVVVVNKWDLIEKDTKTMDNFRKDLMKGFGFMAYVPIIFISAKTGERIDKLLELIKFVDDQNAIRISTGKINEILAVATARVEPPTSKGKRLKIFYMTQTTTRPPTFVCFVNNKDLFHYSYKRYIENQIREVFGLEGTPIHLVVRERGKKDK